MSKSLTFPHNNEYDRRLRMSQVRDIQAVLKEYATKHHVVDGEEWKVKSMLKVM